MNESGNFERPRAVTSVGFLSSGSCAPSRTLASLEILAEMEALGMAVAVESGSGAALDLDDDMYRAAGVTVVDRAEVWRRSEDHYLANEPALSTVGGRPLTVDEYRRLRDLAEH